VGIEIICSSELNGKEGKINKISNSHFYVFLLSVVPLGCEQAQQERIFELL
jgi:hypothetical protein